MCGGYGLNWTNIVYKIADNGCFKSKLQFFRGLIINDMTEDIALTLLNKNTLPMILVLAGALGLAACSSKPAPWSESSSPWENRAEEGELDPVAMEGVEPVPAMEAEVIEPMPMESGEEFPMPADAQAEMPEPMMEEMVIEEPVMDVEPMAVTGGSLGQQPANYFAVQVVASSTMQQLNEFATANQLSTDWIAETSVNGKVWYVLMLGVYPTKAEAEQALAGVQGLETQPWVRSVGSVQSVMMN